LVDIFHYPFPLYRLFFCPANRVWGQFDTGVLNEAVQESVRRMLNEVAPEEELNGTWQMTL